MNCPTCGAGVPAGAAACLTCGASASTGDGAQGAGSGVPAGSSDQMVGRWRVDPVHMHERRFFDDETQTWTDWVADGNVTSRDPIPPTASERLAQDRSEPHAPTRPTPAAAPAAVPGAMPGTGFQTTKTWRFASLSDPATCVMILLAALAVLSGLAMVIDVLAAREVSDMVDQGITSRPDEPSGALLFFEGMKGLQAICWLVTAACFIWWIRRATGNLSALGVSGLPLGTGWAVGGWFVPILSLWRPYQVAAQAWRATAPAVVQGKESWHTQRAGRLLIAWWATYVVANSVAFVPLNVWTQTKQLSTMVDAAYWSVPADGITLVAACVAIVFVRALSKRQTEAARVRGAAT
ncbi:MAG: DUF4328 domain-containing protein [Dehalococcoidia bacterium]